jgi:hypothetical protein
MAPSAGPRTAARSTDEALSSEGADKPSKAPVTYASEFGSAASDAEVQRQPEAGDHGEDEAEVMAWLESVAFLCWDDE